MKQKLTEMDKPGLMFYIHRWLKRQEKYRSGSKNWQKCHRRIKRARKQLDLRMEGT